MNIKNFNKLTSNKKVFKNLTWIEPKKFAEIAIKLKARYIEEK